MEVGAAKLIGAGLAVVALFGVGIGLGMIFSSFLSSVARNPSAKADLTGPMYIGAALTEGIALIAFAVALIILFVF